MKLKLKNYRVIKKIGHGGMGLVYVAEDLALGRLVALKVLAPYLVQDPEILERFRFEARNQAQLLHSNITMVYSFLVEDEQAFLVLEFIDGETLESRINREGRIVAMEALPIFRKILGALGYAHSKGVIHRDIKPGNIAFTSEGNVKIMDFGIALNNEETGRLTKTGHVLGTPHYMAPEQILGKELTFRTDIYALGITLFEMLTGRLPFDSKSDFEVRVAQINRPPPSLRSFGYQDITPELEEVILKALAKEPEARFSSAREFLQALEAAVGRDHLVTLVKGMHLDKSTQILEANREPMPPPPEMEEAGPAAPPAEAQIVEALAPPPPAPEREALPGPSLAEVQEISVAPTPEPIEELTVPPPSEPEGEEPSIPALSEQGEEAPSVPPLSEFHRENEVARSQFRFADGLAIDRGAIAAPQVFDAVRVALEDNSGMAAGNGGIGQVDIVECSPDGIIPADRRLLSRKVENLSFSLLPFYDQSNYPASPALRPSALSPYGPSPNLFSI